MRALVLFEERRYDAHWDVKGIDRWGIDTRKVWIDPAEVASVTAEGFRTHETVPHPHRGIGGGWKDTDRHWRGARVTVRLRCGTEYVREFTALDETASTAQLEAEALAFAQSWGAA